jgi:hypothetical protein
MDLPLLAVDDKTVLPDFDYSSVFFLMIVHFEISFSHSAVCGDLGERMFRLKKAKENRGENATVFSSDHYPVRTKMYKPRSSYSIQLQAPFSLHAWMITSFPLISCFYSYQKMPRKSMPGFGSLRMAIPHQRRIMLTSL